MTDLVLGPWAEKSVLFTGPPNHETLGQPHKTTAAPTIRKLLASARAPASTVVLKGAY
jgi:hypothetical protein